ncbi:MAG: hypothetical protein QNK04_15845 [Myxococcota bacterium]|nr:hypothetical protein [Myxococcota bacterium]
MQKLLMGIVFAALLLVGRVGWNVIMIEPIDVELSEEEFAQQAAEVDEWVSAEIESGSAATARGWLSQPDHTLFEGDPQQVQALVDELYELGAEGVWFTAIEDFGGGKLSASIAARLPEDTTARAAILAKESEFWGETSQDVGQRYVEFSFD